ncbi:MAG: sialidase family protein [Pirellulaceae bacterium]
MIRPAHLLIAALWAILAATWLTAPATAAELELLSVEKIWDAGPHNAFTDLIRYQDKWVCGFRESPAHAGGVKDSKVRVIVSDDGKTWESMATLEDPRGDIRDAKFGILPDGRLMMLTAIQMFDTSKQRHQSLAWYTKDLKTWEGPHDLGDPDIWTWGIQFHEGTGYSIGYRTANPKFARLYATQDGKEFETLVEDLEIKSPYPNESSIVFDQDHTAYCLLRCSGPAQFGTAKPPYTDWTWKVMNAPVGGPELIQLPDGRFLGGGRLYDGKQRTSLFWIDPETAQLTEALKLPSGGDTSYPGFVLKDDILHVSYYSSHEGKSNIYFAQVKIHNE